MGLEIFDVEQCSPDWYRLRLGLPTASEFHCLMVKKGRGEDGESLTRKRYLHRLAAEIVSGQPAETYSNEHMERGRAQEAEARWHYGFVHDVEPERIGFIKNGLAGASPDALIGGSGLLEIKTRLPHLQVELLLSDKLPREHYAQMQGALWVSEREWCDLAVYSPGLPLFVQRQHRDELFIQELIEQVGRFRDELSAAVEKIRRYGSPGPTLTEQLKASLALEATP